MRKKLFNFLPRGGFVKGLLLLAIALLGGVSSGWADPASQYLTNADFASTNGWTNEGTYFSSSGVGKIGTYKARSEFPAATVDATHLATENCLGVECRWSGNVSSYKQTSSAALPAGKYVISYDVENTNNGTANVSWENRFYVKVGETTYNDEKTEWMSGQSSWTTHTIEFTITEPSTFTLSLGYGTGSNNIGHMNTPALFISHLQLKIKMEDVTLPFEMTSFYIQNWDFQNCGWYNLPGWTFSVPNGGNVNNYGNAKTKAEYWNGDLSKGQFDYYQTITGLPKGRYALSASMWHTQGTVAGTAGVYADNGYTSVFKGVTDDCNGDNPHTYDTDGIYVTDGTLRLGVKNNGSFGACWFGVDWIKLSYISADFTAADVNAIIAGIPEGKMANAAQTALNDTKAALQGEASADNFAAMANAIKNAKTSIENYTAAKAILDAAATLDAAGKAAYADNADVAALQTAYDNGTLTAVTSEQKTACEAALRAAAKAQTPADDLDMTLAINNWDFLNCSKRNFPGWTIDAPEGAWSVTNKNYTTVEFWHHSADGMSFDYYQTVTDLPAGKYTISARMWNDQGDVVAPVGVYGSSGSAEVFKGVSNKCNFDANNLVVEETEPIVVANGTLRLGVKSSRIMTSTECKWFGADWVKLTMAEPISTYNSLAEMIAAAPAAPALLKFSNYEVLHQGGDSIVAQVISGGEPLGFVIKGITGVTGAASAVKGTKIAGVIYGSYDAAAHAFTITADPCNTISAAAAEATITKMELAEAVDKEKTYQLIKIEMANVVKEGDDFYAKKNADKIKLDKRLFPELMLYDDEMMNSITGVTFVEGDECVLAPYDQSAMSGNKAEAAAGAAYAQGETVNSVDGVIMTYGGSEDTKKYEFAAATAVVNKLGTVTEGIDQFPVDDEDQAYDKDEENLPTKGTYYVFEPTKDGRLDVTVGLEAKKQLFVTEDGKAIVEKKEDADYNGAITFPVEAMKTYYVFANETNLKYYGFSFTPTNAYAKNIVKNIAMFKELPTPEVNEGDTLMLKDAVVTYIKSDHVFVEDASGAIDFYQTGIQFYVGQKLNGYIVGKNGELQYLPALFRTDDTKYGNFKVTETITPEPTVIDVTEAAMKKNLARFVKLENLMLKKDSRGFKILVDTLTGNNIHVRDHFGVFYELNDTVKSIEGIAGIDADGVYTLWPTSKDGVISSKTIIPEPAFDGKYYLQNMASGLFWGAGNSWGTQASLLSHPAFVTLAKQPDGTYTMESQVNNGGLSHYFNGSYMDNDSPVSLTITPDKIDAEEIVDFDASIYHNWSEVSGTATDNGSANGGVKLNQEVDLGGVLWGNLSGAVPYKDYANLTDYKELRIEGTPGAVLRLMCNRVVDEGPIYELKPTIGEDGKLTIKIDDLKHLNGGADCDFVCLQSIKIPANWQGGTKAATITSMKLVKDVAYTISNGSVMYGYNGTNTVIDATGVSDDDNAKWMIISEKKMLESLGKATQAKPVDATFLILDPDFGRNNRYAGGLATNKDHIKGADLDAAWDFQASNKDNSGANENFCVESYHSLFALSQTLANAPKGVYSLTAQGFYRQDGSDNEHLPVFYANDVTKVFPLKTGSENSMTDASNSFIAGKYTIDPIFVEVTEEGKLTIGTKLEGNTNLWCIWDNFVLTYYGTNANIDELKGGAEMKELQELREKATELSRDEAIEVAAVKTALSNALNQSANVSGSDAIKAAIASLKAAIESAQASKIAKDVLPKMKELVDANNVYTQEAYDQYYGTWIAKYNAGTLTQAEASALQDPTTVTNWQVPITVDNFLLSAWDTNPDFNNAAYYINSWSNEGDRDGTNFHVPFFEYFRRATDGSLEEKTLTATMNGLEAGDYTVNAWVRVALTDKTGDEAYGINMQVNDGTAVDVCDGDMVDCGDSERFFLKEVSANGTVGADGVLTIKFNVASDNNIHWISFKNVKYTKAGAGDETDPNLIEIAQDQGKTLDTFERAELVEGSDYNTYTANNNLVIAFKMVNIDVNNCDYVVVKFAEPVAAGWHLAFWSNQDLVDVEAGATEYKYVFADDPKCSIQDGILPQICMMTFFGGFQAPLVAKVTGVYKHLMGVADKIDGITGNLFDDGAIYNLRGQKVEGKLKPGLYIKNGKKIVIK